MIHSPSARGVLIPLALSFYPLFETLSPIGFANNPWILYDFRFSLFLSPLLYSSFYYPGAALPLTFALPPWKWHNAGLKHPSAGSSSPSLLLPPLPMRCFCRLASLFLAPIADIYITLFTFLASYITSGFFIWKNTFSPAL